MREASCSQWCAACMRPSNAVGLTEATSTLDHCRRNTSYLFFVAYDIHNTLEDWTPSAFLRNLLGGSITFRFGVTHRLLHERPYGRMRQIIFPCNITRNTDLNALHYIWSSSECQSQMHILELWRPRVWKTEFGGIRCVATKYAFSVIICTAKVLEIKNLHQVLRNYHLLINWLKYAHGKAARSLIMMWPPKQDMKSW